MHLFQLVSNALVTIFSSDNKNTLPNIAAILKKYQVRTLMPPDLDTLTQASENSALIIICIYDNDKIEQVYDYVRVLKNNKNIVADIVSIDCRTSNESYKNCKISLVGEGYDDSLDMDDMHNKAFENYLLQRIVRGRARIKQKIQEEEFKRFRDALAVSPVSMLIFDAEKRLVFASDHYLRAYPILASKFVKGLRSYDAFELMI